MTLKDWLQISANKLSAAGITTARLDLLVLLEDVTGQDRAWLLAFPEYELTDVEIKKLDKFVAQRAQHQPLAYLRGKTEFYGREFLINKHVLEPRPESESMIDLLKAHGQKTITNMPATIVDVGTGSGALAITAKLELPDAQIFGIDIDQNCLKIAEQNAKRLEAQVSFLLGDLLAPMTKKLDTEYIILANLPYVPDNFHINPAAMNEPKLAIFGGPDGLDVYRRLFEQIIQLAAKPGLILTESLPPQHVQLAKIASGNGYKLATTDDFIQLFELA